MRLINTTTYAIVDFPAELKRPPYAILSHTWSDSGEVSFSDMQDLKKAKKHPGWPKVEAFCRVALHDDFQWAWDDTCCIDKRSSSELSEAINSMYAWYTAAAKCFAYLHDVNEDEDPADPDSSFRSSRWFTRGWTLQELIAPRVVIILSKNWRPIGTKRSLDRIIQDITHVSRNILAHRDFLEDVSVARRMSWASRRETHRLEDRAYSLMGLFGVNMPVIYGEGDRAFIRLQLEIIQQSPDHSIFAWGKFTHDFETLHDNIPSLIDRSSHWASEFRGILATAPQDFEHSASIRTLSLEEFSRRVDIQIHVPEYQRTNYGILIHLPLYEYPSQKHGLCLAVLACQDEKQNLIALLLQGSGGSPRRFHVGMNLYGIPNLDRHPSFRRIAVPPRPPPSTTSHRLTAHFWQNLALQRMYIHAYNTNPQRSTREGVEGKQLRLHPLRSETTSSMSSTRRPAAERIFFDFPGYALARLRQAGFRVCGWPRNAPNGRAGWTPMNSWTCVGAATSAAPSLELRVEPALEREDSKTVIRHGALLFRGRNEADFVVVVGVLADGDWEAMVIFRGRDGLLMDWTLDDHDVVKVVWEASHGHFLNSRANVPRLEVSGKQRREPVLTFGGQRGSGRVRLTFTPWSEETEGAGVKGAKRTLKYTVSVEVDYGPDARVWASSSREDEKHLSSLSHTGAAP